MFPLLAATALALGFARVLDAPGWTYRAIPLAALAFATLAIIALPADNPFRASLLSGGTAVAVTALIVGPVAAYLVFLRRVRKRRAPEPTPAITGQFVRVEEDAALRRDMRAGTSGGSGFSLLCRDAAGDVAAAAALDPLGRRLMVQHVHVADETLLPELADTIRQAAQEDGFSQVVLTDARAAVVEQFAARGYQETSRTRLQGEPDLVTLIWTAP